jgi:hypothetical protein
VRSTVLARLRLVRHARSGSRSTQAEEADRQRQVALAALRRAVRVGLVSCGKSKRPGTHAARDLYISALFRLAIRADRIIESYDQRLPGDQKYLCLWGVNARNTLTCSYPHFTVDLTFYAGAHYVAPILAAGLPQDWRHDEPLEASASVLDSPGSRRVSRS